MAGTVLIAGGCAAQAIKRGLSSSPQASAMFQFVDLPVHLTSLYDQAWLDIITEASFIFVEQAAEVDRAFIQAHARAGCPIIAFPEMVLRSLWPFDSHYDYPDDVAERAAAPAIKHFDGTLGRLRKLEPDKKKRIVRYRALDFPWADQIEFVAAAQQRYLDRADRLVPSGLGHFVSRHFQERQLFYNASHPSAAYFQELCTFCWRHLGLPGVPASLKGIDSWRDWSVPVHPGIARRLGVRWATENTRYYYRTLGEMTWDAWVEQYVEIFG